MNRSISWALFVVAFIAFGASFSELERMRGRFGEVTRHQFHDHLDVRQFMIRAALAGLDHPIVILGDSITEMARFPESIDGYPVVNAGIGGATIDDFVSRSARLLDGITPSVIVVALGANDVGSSRVQAEYGALLSYLKKRAPAVYAVAVTPLDGAEAINSQIVAAAKSADVPVIETFIPKAMLTDGIHANPEGSRRWTAAVLAAIPGGPRS
jgi:lysophospholipase L1-like esterase